MKQEQKSYLSPSLRVVQIQGMENVCDNLSSGGNAPDYNYRDGGSLIWEDGE